MTLGTLQKALIEGIVEDPSLARKIASAGRVYSGIAAADTNATAANQNATNAHTRLNDPVLLGKYQLDLGVQSVVGALALANLPAIPQEKLNAITDPSKLVSATLGVLQNASANQSGYAGFQSAVGANLLAAWTVVAGRAIIANATITNAHVNDFSANKMTAGTINTGTITIQTLLQAGNTTIDGSGISLLSVSTFGENPNSNHSSKLTSRPGGDGVVFSALGFAVAADFSSRGAFLTAAGVANSAEDGLVQLSATTVAGADLNATASAYINIHSVFGGTGAVDVHAKFNAFGDINSTTGNYFSGGNPMVLQTAGAAVNILSGNLNLGGDVINNGGYRVQPARTTAILSQGGGGTVVTYNHSLGSIPHDVRGRYSGVGSNYWRPMGQFGDATDVTVNGFDATTFTVKNSNAATQQIQLELWA